MPPPFLLLLISLPNLIHSSGVYASAVPKHIHQKTIYTRTRQKKFLSTASPPRSICYAEAALGEASAVPPAGAGEEAGGRLAAPGRLERKLGRELLRPAVEAGEML